MPADKIIRMARLEGCPRCAATVDIPAGVDHASCGRCRLRFSPRVYVYADRPCEAEFDVR